MRLAVMFAMQPFENRSRAFAMSTRPVNTGMPTASIVSTSGGNERQRDVEVVNHQVEHDVDIEAAFGKGAEAVHFDEAWIDENLPRRGHRRVEPLGVTDRERGAAPGSRGNHGVGLGDRPGNRLLDEDGYARLEERQRDLGVHLRRRRNRHRIHLAVELTHVEQRACTVGCGDLLGTGTIDVDDGGQRDAGQR